MLSTPKSKQRRPSSGRTNSDDIDGFGMTRMSPSSEDMTATRASPSSSVRFQGDDNYDEAHHPSSSPSQRQQQRQAQNNPHYYSNGNNASNTPTSLHSTTSSNYVPPRFLFDEEDEISETTEEGNVGVGGLPSEAQLVLLCLDYLRGLRRSYGSGDDLKMAEGLHADYISIAIYALSRAFLRPNQLVTAYRQRKDEEDAGDDCDVEIGDDDELQVDESAMNAAGNDAYFEPSINAPPGYYSSEGKYRKKKSKGQSDISKAGNDGDNSNDLSTKVKAVQLPSLEIINREVLYDKNPDEDDEDGGNTETGEEEKAQDPTAWYEYDDSHISNSHRFYTLNGLASGSSARGRPLTLGEITAAGLAGLGARSRIDAERDMVKSPLFEQFVSAVRAKGFFKDAEAPLKEGDVAAAAGVEGDETGEGQDGADEGKEQDEDKRERLRRAQEIHEERYRKVVAKFRTKLASKAEQQQLQQYYHGHHNQQQILSPRVLGDLMSPSSASAAAGMTPSGNASVASHSTTGTGGGLGMGGGMNGTLMAISAAERQKRRRARRIEAAKMKHSASPTSRASTTVGPLPPPPPPPPLPSQPLPQGLGMSDVTTPLRRNIKNNTGVAQQSSSLSSPSHRSPSPVSSSNQPQASPPTSSSAQMQHPQQDQQKQSLPRHNQIDIEQAEKIKQTGNSFMSQKNYAKAVESYTTALKICPDGPHSHVYFSNRAAALLSMKRFEEAISDSERSLALKPDYGKAYSRLGLAHFLLGNYESAVEAYTVALKYEPNNKTSTGYLEKAKKKLSQQRKKNSGNGDNAGANMNSTRRRREMSLERRNARNMNQDRRGGNSGEESNDVAGPATAASPGSNAPSRSSRQQHHQQPKQDSTTTCDVSQQGHQQQRGTISSNDAAIASEEKEQAKKHLIDQKEADKLKLEGNTYMSTKEYQNAIDAYTAAIRLNPAGPSSHVYFSNRAAALCYLERYEEAEMDSERSLALRPEYSKAHARLGLSRFFLGDYEGSVEAYTAALRLDPKNAASRSYLAKARKKLEEMGISTEEEYDAGDGHDKDLGMKENSDSRGSETEENDSAVNGTGNDSALCDGGNVSEVTPTPPPESAPAASPSSRVMAAATAIAMDESGDSLPKPTLEDFIAEMERISDMLKEEDIDYDNISKGSSQDVGGEAGDAIDSLLNDPYMMEIIDSLYLDEKSMRDVKSRMTDPSVVDALMEARQVSLVESEI